MAEAVAYEEQRRRQIEANKRKLEELQLHHLSAAVREAAAAAKPSSAKKRKTRVPRDDAAEPLRRSGRVANLPENEKPVYRKDSDEERSYQDSDEERSYKDSDEESSYQDSDDERSYAISKAEKPMYCHVSKSNARVPRAATSVVAEPLRWSGRLANLPEKPMYREDSDEERSYQDSDEERSYQDSDEEWSYQDSDEVRKRNARVPLDAAERSYAISKAEELVQKLGSSFPIFTLPMTLFHVTGVFRPGFPTYFCQKHLPKSDEMITLVDEEDDKFCMLYQPSKAALSTGWGGFVIEHKLLHGDCLVFQLIEWTMFKVYIIRATSYFESEH